MELNKIFASLLVAGIIAMGAALLSDGLYGPDQPAEQAFRIAPELEEEAEAAEEVAAAEEAAAPGIPSVLPLLADADTAAGEQAAVVCAACHSFDPGGPNLVGPNNWDIVGARMGHVEGFNYSAGLAERHEAGDVWTYDELNAFLLAPMEYLPGTSMVYAGVADLEERANLIAWLRTLSDDPVPLPTPEEIAAVTGDAAAEEPAAEEPAAEEPVAEEPVAEEPAAEEPAAEEPAAETAATEEPAAEEAATEEPAAEEPAAEEPAAETADEPTATAEAGGAGPGWGTPADLAARLAAADPANGEAQAAICMACHNFQEGGPNMVGPNNWNVIGSQMGHVEGFTYTPGFQARSEAGDVWTYAELDAFLAAPMQYMTGTTMAFAGVPDDQTRADIIAWLRLQSPDPVPLPSP